jgi:hypothetical protein
MSFISVAQASDRVERLLAIIREAEGIPTPFEGVEGGLISLWSILEDLSQTKDIDLNDQDACQRHILGAGVHDPAAKVSAVWDGRPDVRQQLIPHLKLLAETFLCWAK